ncbi:nitrous oxide-stimulated promoter family protein [Pontiellaceae bacterium B12227]|nr:nitrous oxide-stimulated promoter family protein [Pontiellaceae bacterium B12227]
MNLEIKTIKAMIRLFCKKNHVGQSHPCRDCLAVEKYALQRIENCPFGNEKPVCNQCTVHCYKPEMRERVKEVMRFSGPRMLLRHPVLAVRHLIRSRFYSGKRSK